MGAIETLQEVIHTVKSQFDFIYEKQTDKPTVSYHYWTNYRLEALWTISGLILICLKVYKRFQQYRRYQSSAFIMVLNLLLITTNVPLSHFADSEAVCSTTTSILSHLFKVYSVHCHLQVPHQISYGLTFAFMTLKLTKNYISTRHFLLTTSRLDAYNAFWQPNIKLTHSYLKRVKHHLFLYAVTTVITLPLTYNNLPIIYQFTPHTMYCPYWKLTTQTHKSLTIGNINITHAHQMQIIQFSGIMKQNTKL